MEDLLKKLETSFTDRCKNQALGNSMWEAVSAEFPPVAQKHTDIKTFQPSTIFSLISGDLGISVLWIVETYLIRQLINKDSKLNDSSAHAQLLSCINSNYIGALAHTENQEDPLTMSIQGDEIILNGIKKYITGGMQCKFILLTARFSREDKISQLVFVPVDMLPAGSLQDIGFRALKTTSHAKLQIKNLRLARNNIIEFDPPALRKALRILGTIERTMLLESYIALCIYIANRLQGPGLSGNSDIEILKKLLEEQEEIFRIQLEQAQKGLFIVRQSIDIALFLSIVERLNNVFTEHGESLPEDLIARLPDLNLFSFIKA